jgi:guanylate kinase
MMNIEKQKLKVQIITGEGLSVKGFMYVDQGMRLNDFLNSRKDDFLAVTEARLKSAGAFLGLSRNKKIVFINKNFIKLIEECK